MTGELVRAADAAQYVREPIPEEQRGQIRVRLLNATPDPLGSIAALCEQYKGHVIRALSEVTDEQRKSCLDDMGKTVLNGPLEVAQFHFQIEGVTRSITHQMVRSRASFFAQESLRFAVPEGDWADEIPYPPSIAGPQDTSATENARARWREAMMNAQHAYEDLLNMGIPAEEARGVLPHDMPTRIHWVCDLRTLLAEAGKRTCTQAQQPWRMIFAGIANALRERGRPGTSVMYPNAYGANPDGWQFMLIADKLRPVCYQTGSCGFMAAFDRSCKIRERVGILGSEGAGLPSDTWHNPYPVHEGKAPISIQSWEWAADPTAARS
jgi:flavin-dependent thymidylate synthase